MLVAGAQAFGGLHRPLYDRLSDLQVYLGSVGQLWHGGSLYDYAAAASGAPFTYPPFAALVLSPLAFPPFMVAAVGWSVATFAVVAWVAVVVVRRSELRYARLPWLPPAVAVALCASAPISSNFRFGQVSVFLVAMILVDALGILPERFRGVATGIAGAIKLTPLVFVPYYWVSGQRCTAVTAVLTFVGCTALAWLVLPAESTRFWFTEIWNVNRVGNITTGGNQSLNGALLRWGVSGAPRTATVAVLGAAVVGLALWRAARAYRGGRPFAAVVMVGSAGLVLSPVSWTHHQVWLVLAAFVAVTGRRTVDWWWAAIVLVVMVLPVTSVGAGLPGGAVTGNARLWLAIAVAAVVPFVAVRRVAAVSAPAGASAGNPGDGER